MDSKKLNKLLLESRKTLSEKEAEAKWLESRGWATWYNENFKEKLEEIKSDLSVSGFQLEKEIVEFSVFDTKVSHDAAWILQK